MTEYIFETYPKIYGPFKRHTEGELKNKLDRTRWYSEEFEALQDVPWYFSEKVDGTNIRVGWDGHRVQFGGRTDRAQIPGPLLEHLTEAFPEEIFEQVFGDSAVTLFGEGFGGKIQSMSHIYGTEQRFVLFDVKVGRWWLKPEDVQNIGLNMGIDTVPTETMTLNNAISLVSMGVHSEFNENYLSEGLVGVPVGGMLSRSGQRIQVKVKTCDFKAKLWLGFSLRLTARKMSPGSLSPGLSARMV